MNWSDVGQQISKYAPMVGMALSSPVGAVSAVAVMLANAFGVEANPNEVMRAINSDPDSAKKIQELIANNIEMQKISLDIIRAENDAVANARDREIKLAQAGYNDWVPRVLSMGIMIIYAVVHIYAVHNPTAQTELLSARVQDLFLIIIGYYFGTSSSSRKKDDIIAYHSKQLGG